ALADHPVGVFTGQPSSSVYEGKVDLPPISPLEHVIEDYSSTTLSLKAHPVSFTREKLNLLHVTPSGQLNTMKDGMLVKVCGLITVRQSPGAAKGVLFSTIADDSGFSNLVVWEKTFEICRKVIWQARLLLIVGKLQIEREVIHIVVHSCHNMNHLLHIDNQSRNIGSVHKPAQSREKDSKLSTVDDGQKFVQGELFPSRDFK